MQAKLLEAIGEADVDKTGKLDFTEFCEFLKLAKKDLGVTQNLEQHVRARPSHAVRVAVRTLLVVTRPPPDTAGARDV